MKTIEITISPQGQTKIETKGFEGEACREASRRLEQALGQRTAEELKSEFYTQQSASQPIRQTT